jgi:aspartate racemase
LLRWWAGPLRAWIAEQTVLTMHIGLIGGIGPAATDFYYRRLIKAFALSQSPLELTIVHADTPTLLNNLELNDIEAQVGLYLKLTLRLAAAGAGCVAVTSIAGHFPIEAFKAVSPLPVIDMIIEVKRTIEAKGFKRLGILGTRTVMESRLYGAIPNVTVIPPKGPDLDEVHEAYVTMAASGVVTPDQRASFIRAGQTMGQDYGAQAIILGGTDLALAFEGDHTPFPVLDCAALHADAIEAFAKA